MGKIVRTESEKDPTDKSKFRYYHTDGTEVRDKTILGHIEELRIPPMWRQVTVFYPPAAGQRQTCCGLDAKGRTQCLYNAAWLKKARAKKYCDLIHFGAVLPRIQADMTTALRSARMTKAKIIALVLRIVTSCGFRLGTLNYEVQNDSYGCTTIRKKHIRFADHQAHIKFVGKKNVINECTITDVAIVDILRELCTVKKSDDHVMMYQLAGEWIHIRHVDVNNWLKEYGENITSKDFRTFYANEMFIDYMRNQETRDPNGMKISARKREVNEAVDVVSTQIHNTRAICKKDYLDSDIWQMYIDHPVKYRSNFLTPKAASRILFINWLRKKCL